MVTVSEVVDMTLGDVSGLMATGGDGMVTLTWDAADNADVYYIAGISQDDRAVRNYANVIFQEAMSGVELTGLTNGMAYDFTVIAGQTAADGSRTWSAWHSIVSATPMAASSGGPGKPFG